MNEHRDSNKAIALRFFKNVYLTYDIVVRITTFYNDPLWKREIVKLVPKACNALDLACGTGILTLLLTDKSDRVYGLDIIYKNLIVAYKKKKRLHANIEFVNADAEYIPFKDNAFDVVTASYLPKYVNAKLLIRECKRVLKDNGIIILHDFVYPRCIIVRYLWHFYFLILKFVGLFAKEWRSIFYELDKVIAESRWIDDVLYELNANGFTCINCRYLTLGTSAIVYARVRK
jgi:demethylmenaquinone methyltransferase/2-methoxy-6-polyprenyl-1,4-benzoquinol methylase